ncbi:MAG: TolC family protein [Ferruginibacter sp.]|uniref:TolC family protein n=1 Tax=Ferruginibacter sp. TaxID=1940288 RepID=UPI002659EE51|nr:TolC family protein [Ferruginibacter sp.]MDB5277107.1 TolC family protein [Ferruginibacter sp.]
MHKNKRILTQQILLLIIFLSAHQLLNAQHLNELTIDQCYKLAAANSPLYQQKALTIAAGNKTEKNINLKWLPQLDINAQATYQSDVTSLPIKLPNLTIESLDKDQYKGTLDLVQPVYDGGLIAGQKKLQRITTQTEAQRVEVDLYQLKTSINNYYFTALLMAENVQLLNLAEENLNNSLKIVAAQVTNGVAIKSNADVLKAELLKTAQQKIEFASAKKEAIEMLAILTGADVDQNTVLSKPVTSIKNADTIAARPELKLFDFQQQSIQLQSQLITAKTNPKLSLFADGGYGKPGLNQLKNSFQWFYISGVRLNIPIMSRITQQKDKDVLKIQQQVVNKQRENFLKNNQQLLVRQKGEIDKYNQLVQSDSAIINLRTSIRENAALQLSNGIITSNDFIREQNAESQTMLNQKLHEVSLLQAQYNYKIITGE